MWARCDVYDCPVMSFNQFLGWFIFFTYFLRTHVFCLFLPPPFPQMDIIGAMMIVWRVRGKIIRSVLCNIVCNNCAQCNAHTYEQT